MQFASMTEFLNMGGHALYVWLSYSLAIIILVFNLVGPWLNQKKIFTMLRRKAVRENLKK